uniref:neprilysin-like isoform X1 n=2 Tax=Styela clava TaxID=7725 RepID=UPI00193AB57E|nr:neprilysin-like isoform X1 [Styela clava]
MSNRRKEFKEKGRSDFKYSEIVSMTDLANFKNGNCPQGDQNQNSIDSNSVCTLPTTVLLSNSGTPTTKAMEYQSKDALDFDVARIKTQKYKKRALIFGAIAGIMTVATIVLAILLGVGVGQSAPKSPPTEEPPQEMCTSQPCVTAASRILNSMDQTTDPCDDFFTYACGQWNIDHGNIPEDKSSVSTFNDVRDSVSETLKRVLETDSTGDRSSIQKAKTFYTSCMDTDKIDAFKGTPALSIADEMGGVPLFGDPLPADFNLEEALAKSISIYGSYGIVSMWVGSDDKNSSATIIQVDQPALGMPNRDYYLDEKRNLTLPGYSQFMRDFMGKLWMEKNQTTYNETVVWEVTEKMIALETDLASIMMKPEDRRDSSAIYKKRTVQAMYDDIASDFDWEKYLNTALEIVSTTVERSRDMVSYGDQYLSNFTKVIAKYDNELIQNYMVWMVLKGRVSYLGKEYRDTQAPYRLAVSGTSAEKARWQTCSDNSNSRFPMPVGALFVQEKFAEENKQVTETMVENIRTAFINFLPGNEWMDDDTKTQAEKKANQITPIIAYPDYILDKEDPKMDNEYTAANVATDEYFQNMQNMIYFKNVENMKKLDKDVDREEWITGPAVVNAFYAPTRNQIVFPAGILQPPFYDEGQPNSMNYGGIGMVIGHEITHGFDDSGSQYNGIGNLENWWSNSSRTNFEGKAKCMEEQYSGYYWEDAQQNLNGKLTLGENIADNGGIRQAYDAYQTWRQQNDADLLLPGLQEFTQDQLFFLSMAQVWCGVYRPEYATRLAATDSHSPGIYRVIGSLSNFDKFGDAYSCSKGTDNMYPNEEDTCRVW